MLELDTGSRQPRYSLAQVAAASMLSVVAALGVVHGCTTPERIAIARIGHDVASVACTAEPYLDAATGTTAIHIHLVMQPKGVSVVTSTKTGGLTL
jgi:hypothetical protein